MPKTFDPPVNGIPLRLLDPDLTQTELLELVDESFNAFINAATGSSDQQWAGLVCIYALKELCREVPA